MRADRQTRVWLQWGLSSYLKLNSDIRVAW